MQQTSDVSDRYWNEFFSGNDNKEVVEKMDTRLSELESKGHTLIKRVEISRNQKCPCGSGKKFKKCCISLIDQKIYDFMERGKYEKS